jgi:hypothetical protein
VGDEIRVEIEGWACYETRIASREGSLTGRPAVIDITAIGTWRSARPTSMRLAPTTGRASGSSGRPRPTGLSI